MSNGNNKAGLATNTLPPNIGSGNGVAWGRTDPVLDVDGVCKIQGSLAIDGSLTITDSHNTMDVVDFMKSVNERLCILQPSLEAHEHYPALKDAYDQYKMLEKLLLQGNVKKD